MFLENTKQVQDQVVLTDIELKRGAVVAKTPLQQILLTVCETSLMRRSPSKNDRF